MGALFTPGPWRVEPSIYEHMAAEIVAERGLAQVWVGENAMADARLIAATPELLAALRKVDADWTEAFPHGPEGDVSCWGGMGRMSEKTRQTWLEIRAALAKAGAL